MNKVGLLGFLYYITLVSAYNSVIGSSSSKTNLENIRIKNAYWFLFYFGLVSGMIICYLSCYHIFFKNCCYCCGNRPRKNRSVSENI